MTNIAATRLDVKRVVLSDTIETAITLEATNVFRYVEFQARGGTVRISFSPGGTSSSDNYHSIDNAQRWPIYDVAVRCLDSAGVFCYARAEAENVTLEIAWGQ